VLQNFVIQKAILSGQGLAWQKTDESPSVATGPGNIFNRLFSQIITLTVSFVKGDLRQA